MASVAISRPCSQNLTSPSAAPQFEAYQSALFLLPQSRAPVRSHYRPFSTIYLQEEPVPIVSKRSSLLLKPRRPPTAQRSGSVGEVMGLGRKKNMEKEKEKEKELPILRPRNLSDISASTPPPLSMAKTASRPQTSGGYTVTERSSVNGKAALHRVRAQRSMASLFSAANEPSPNSASPENTPRPTKPPPPSSFRPPKMDVDKRPTTPVSVRQKRLSNVDLDDDINIKKSDTFIESDVWFTRSGTKVHPYTKEVPYMQAYDITSLDNDRYSELLLQRLNPNSPSFFEYGKKPPLTALDLGCGQGHWVLWAASVWKNSRITGFDLMDVTLPAFQVTENVNFVRGNFLLKLPFPAKSFEYIRLSNLALCVPYHQWLPLLTEVRRVLTNGGRMELIDDQIFFPYGEEPKEPSIKSDSPKDSSFFDFGDDSDGDDDTLEDEDSTSTASTLVSEHDSNILLDKLPSSNRSSTQPTSVIDQSTRDKPLPQATKRITTSTTDRSVALPDISPSPTITQANINSLDRDLGLATSTTITDSTPVPERKRHNKTGSSSSTNSNSETVSNWKRKVQGCKDLESIFETVLINKGGLHPRPSEFVLDSMRRIFGKGNAGKIRSYHIKLAPYDSPIGPGGTMAPGTKTEEHDKESKSTMSSSDQLKKHWKDKKEKKEKKRELKRAIKDEFTGATSRTSFEEYTPLPLPQPPVISAKAASRLGLAPTIPPVPKRLSTPLSTGSDSSSSESTSSSGRSSMLLSRPPMPVVTAKAASRLGIPITPPPLPPKSSSSIRGSDNQTALRQPPHDSVKPPVPPKTSGYLGVSPVKPIPRSVSTGTTFTTAASLRPTSSSSDNLEGAKFTKPSAPSLHSIERSCSSDSTQSSSSEQSLSDNQIALPPTLSAKAAGRLGISYSVLAAASASHGRGNGAMAPVQSPGLLIWPSTYIAMSPTELEMHSCKYVQTLLGCRHALRGFITGDFDGGHLVTDQEFDEAIWEYECFRRSRIHWPNDNAELFDERGFPELPPPSLSPPREAANRNAGKPGHSRTNSLESFNGQYRRDDLTHVRTIRVFEAVKAIDEKSLVAMLFPNDAQKTPAHSP